jgi:hypothetical protein
MILAVYASQVAAGKKYIADTPVSAYNGFFPFMKANGNGVYSRIGSAIAVTDCKPVGQAFARA